MIFDQYSITSIIVDYLDLPDLDNLCEISSDLNDVVKCCCRLKKKSLLRNRWLKINYLLMKHPNVVGNGENNTDLFFNSYYGLSVFVTIDKPTNKLNLNIQSVFGTKVKFDYDLPEKLSSYQLGPNDWISCSIFKIPPFFSTHKKISHIGRSIIYGQSYFWNLNFVDLLTSLNSSTLSNWNQKPLMIVTDGYDSDDEGDHSLNFKKIFGDDDLSSFPHLTKTNEKVDFGSFEPLEYSYYRAETFISENDSDVYFYDDLVDLDAVVVKFRENQIIDYVRFSTPFKNGISFTRVLGKQYYFIANMRKTKYKIFDFSSKPVIYHRLPKGHTIINIKYVCDDIVILFSNNKEEYYITLIKILTNQLLSVPKYLKDNIKFSRLCLTFEKLDFIDNILVMFIDKNNLPQSCYLLETSMMKN